MKKIMAALSIVALFASYSCDNNNDDPSYLDNKLIEGTWSGKLECDSLVYIFSENNAIHKIYTLVGHMDTLKLSLNSDLGNYLLTDSSVMFPYHQDKNFNYKLYMKNDSLFIKNLTYSMGVGLKRLKK